MEHLLRIIELHSGTVAIIEDHAKAHSQSATGSAEVLPALWQFTKAHRRRSKSRDSKINTDRRWDAEETLISPRSPNVTTVRLKEQSLPTPPLFSANSPKSLPVHDRSCASPKCPKRQPSALLVDRSPRKPERRKVSPPIGTINELPKKNKNLLAKPSPASVMDNDIIPSSPIRRREAVRGFRDDTPNASAKKTVLRQSLAQAIDFFDLDSDSSDEEQDSFGEAPRFPRIHAL